MQTTRRVYKRGDVTKVIITRLVFIGKDQKLDTMKLVFIFITVCIVSAFGGSVEFESSPSVVDDIKNEVEAPKSAETTLKSKDDLETEFQALKSGPAIFGKKQACMINCCVTSTINLYNIQLLSFIND